VEGKPCAKVGRSYRPNPRLERVEWPRRPCVPGGSAYFSGEV